MLGIRFLGDVFVDFALARGIEDLFLDGGVDHQLGADLIGELLLLILAVGTASVFICVFGHRY